MFEQIDIIFYVLILAVFILGIYAQLKVSSTFNKYNHNKPLSNVSGESAVQHLLSCAGLSNIKIRRIKGELTDNYNSKTKTISLSDSTTSNTSISSLGVVAHEIGHAMQDRDNYAPLRIRSIVAPLAKIGSIAFYPLFIIGLILLIATTYTATGRVLIYVATGLYFLSTLFYIVTLSVERDASKRALELLHSSNVLQVDELPKAKEVLKAAELTYLTALLTSLIYFLRFFFYALRVLKRD